MTLWRSVQWTCKIRSWTKICSKLTELRYQCSYFGHTLIQSHPALIGVNKEGNFRLSTAPRDAPKLGSSLLPKEVSYHWPASFRLLVLSTLQFTLIKFCSEKVNFDLNMHDWTTITVGEISYIESRSKFYDNFELLTKFILSQYSKVEFRKSDLAHL